MATPAQNIVVPSDRLNKSISASHSVSTSPSATFQSPSSSFGGPQSKRAAASAAKPLKPFDTQDVKILLLENVNETGISILESQGYQVEAIKTSLPEDQLIEKIRRVTTAPDGYCILLTDLR